MHVIHVRGGSKAAWERLRRDQDIGGIDKPAEVAEFEELLES
jgi:hypothetical protein